MKTLLIPLFLLISPIVNSQENNVFDGEWYQKLESELEYIIFPNPSEEKLNIRIYRSNSTEHSLYIKNMLGQLVYSCDIKKEDQINITNLKNGIYFLTVYNSNKQLTQILKIK